MKARLWSRAFKRTSLAVAAAVAVTALSIAIPEAFGVRVHLRVSPAAAPGAGTPASTSASAQGSATASGAQAGSGPLYDVTSVPPATTNSIGLWAADWGGAAGSRSAAGWQAAAQNERIMIGVPGVYRNWISKLHGWNPSLTVLAYNLGPYLQKGSTDYNTVLSQHPDWFAHDSRGRQINLPMFPSNYLMEMGNSAYRAWHSQQLAAQVATYGFDGAMDDSMGPGALGNYSSSPPINPATHQPYTDAQYLANAVLMLNSDKAALKGKYLAFNGLISGQEYALATHILATSQANAGVSELFLRQPTSSVNYFPNMTELQQSLQMMSDMAAHAKALLGWTKVWVPASASQVAKWEAFALATYLLGQQSASYLDFMASRTADNTAVTFSNLKSQLGAPLGAYALQGVNLVRSFQHGLVTLNTSVDTAVITVG